MASESSPSIAGSFEPGPAAPGFMPVPVRQLQQKARALKRQLRTTSRALHRARFPLSHPIEQPQPEIAPPLPVVETLAAPASSLSAAEVGSIVTKAPVLVELQYEVLDLRHEIDALKQELAALRVSATQLPAELKTSQLSIIDAAGNTIAGISSGGVVSCRMIEMHPGKG